MVFQSKAMHTPVNAYTRLLPPQAPSHGGGRILPPSPLLPFLFAFPLLPCQLLAAPSADLRRPALHPLVLPPPAALPWRQPDPGATGSEVRAGGRLGGAGRNRSAWRDVAGKGANVKSMPRIGLPLSRDTCRSGNARLLPAHPLHGV